MNGSKRYRLYVVDSSITGRQRAAVIKAIDNSAPKGSQYFFATGFKNFREQLDTLSRPAEIRKRGHINDMTIIAHGSPTGFFSLGSGLVGNNDFNTVPKPYAAFADNARIDIIRCVFTGFSGYSSTQEERRSLYKTIAMRLLPRGGRVSGTANDVDLSTGGGVLLTRPQGLRRVPVGGRYPTTYHSLEILKRMPQEYEAYTTHTVRYGDRVWYLADDYGYRNRQGFTDDVFLLNPGIEFEKLKPGQVIKVPTRVGIPGTLSVPYALRERQAMRTPAGAPFGPVHPSTLGMLGEHLRRSFGTERRSDASRGGIPGFGAAGGGAPASSRSSRNFNPALDAASRTAVPAFDTIGALRRLEREAAERQKSREWLERVRKQLDRRTSGGGLPGRFPPAGYSTAGGTPAGGVYQSTLRVLDAHLRKSFGAAPQSTTSRIGASPFGRASGFVEPSFDTMSTLRRIEREAMDRQRTQQWLQSVQRQLDRRPPGITPSAGGYPSTLELLHRHLKKSF